MPRLRSRERESYVTGSNRWTLYRTPLSCQLSSVCPLSLPWRFIHFLVLHTIIQFNFYVWLQHNWLLSLLIHSYHNRNRLFGGRFGIIPGPRIPLILPDLSPIHWYWYYTRYPFTLYYDYSISASLSLHLYQLFIRKFTSLLVLSHLRVTLLNSCSGGSLFVMSLSLTLLFLLISVFCH